MSEKVVLPKFDLSGSGPHPAVRALWIVGGLLGVSMLVLGGAVWRHHAAQETAAQEAKAQSAAKVAEAAAATEAARVKAAEAVAAKSAGQLGTAKLGATTGQAPAAPVAAAETHHRASGHHGSSKKSAKTIATPKGNVMARTDAHGKAGAASKKKGDDAIDKLLASFK